MKAMYFEIIERNEKDYADFASILEEYHGSP